VILQEKCVKFKQLFPKITQNYFWSFLPPIIPKLFWHNVCMPKKHLYNPSSHNGKYPRFTREAHPLISWCVNKGIHTSFTAWLSLLTYHIINIINSAATVWYGRNILQWSQRYAEVCIMYTHTHWVQVNYAVRPESNMLKSLPKMLAGIPKNFAYYASQCSYYACIMLLSCSDYLHCHEVLTALLEYFTTKWLFYWRALI